MGQSKEGKQNNGRRGMYVSLICLICFTHSDALTVKTNDSLIPALLDKDLTISCLYSEYNDATLDLQKVTVRWNHRTVNGSVNKVYEYTSLKHNSWRSGSYIRDDDLKMGNASLHIPRVRISDDGEYTCTVFYTPDKAESKVSLQVQAQPAITLADDVLKVLRGSEKTATCEVIGFYPESVTIQWVQYLKNGQGCVKLDRQVCTNNPTINEHGTYNVRSRLTLNPDLEDNGNSYSCLVEHVSFPGEQTKNFTLTVTEVSKANVAVPVVVALLVVSVIAGVFLLWHYRKKVPPTLSSITGNESLIHKNRVTLTCQITNFRPKDLKISVTLQKPGGEPVEVYPWTPVSTGARTTPARDEGDGRQNYQSLNMANNGDLVPLLQRRMDLEVIDDVKSNRMTRVSSCQCSIRLTPDFDEDNNAMLSLLVKHDALKTPRSVECVFRVVGVPPKLSKILAPLHIIHEQDLTLTCVINGFKPRPLCIKWLREGAEDGAGHPTELVTSDGSGDKIHRPNAKYSHSFTEKTNDDDQTFSIISTLTMKPSITEDHGTKYICKVFHPATVKSEEQSMVMAVLAKPVLDPITNRQDEADEALHLDKAIELSCRIHSFHPPELMVSWYKGDEEIPFTDRNVLTDPNGLSSVTSVLSYAPRIEDIGQVFRCEAKHESLQTPVRQTWKLRNLICRPKISEIQCEPDTPERGKPIRLSCAIKDFYPELSEVTWLRGSEEMPVGADTEHARRDAASGLFSTNTTLQFIPSINDHGINFFVSVYHSGRISKKKLCMSLKGLPHFKEIACDAPRPEYGKALRLCCAVESCVPADVSAEWLENNTPVARNESIKTKEDDKKNQKSFELLITPTAEDFAKFYTCRVRHKDMQEPVKKNFTLKLPEISPTLSEITAVPLKPEVGRETTFTIHISRFAPKPLQVKWFREFQALTENSARSEQRDGLLYCTSTLRYIPRNNDINVRIRCEVTHAASRKTQEKCYIFNVKGFLQFDGQPGPTSTQQKASEKQKPQLSAITCVTAFPRAGEDVTLTCLIMGQKAKDGTFSWHNGMFPIEDGVQTRDAEDNSGCQSSVTFRPEPSEQECPIRFEAVFNHESLEKNYILKLV